tara:strand:+ start:6361 stop:6855 length:495 start_codon:yes stop_codon:yes gene_type:complete
MSKKIMRGSGSKGAPFNFGKNMFDNSPNSCENYNGLDDPSYNNNVGFSHVGTDGPFDLFSLGPRNLKYVKGGRRTRKPRKARKSRQSRQAGKKNMFTKYKKYLSNTRGGKRNTRRTTRRTSRKTNRRTSRSRKMRGSGCSGCTKLRGIDNTMKQYSTFDPRNRF